MQKSKRDSSILVLCGIFFLLVIILSACGGGAPEEPPSAVVEEVEVVEEAAEEMEEEMAEEEMAEEPMAEEEAADPVSATSSEDEEGSPHLPESGSKAEPTRAAAEVALADAEVRVVEEEAADGLVEISAEVSSEISTDSLLTAGEIDDNENWDDYLLYLRQYDGPEIIWIDVVERHLLMVVDGNGRPIFGKQIDLLVDGQLVTSLHTHSDGSILIFPNAYDLPADTAMVEAKLVETGEAVMIELGGSQREWLLEADSYLSQSDVKLDLHFLIDTTGSMADEINQLRDNMIAISQQIDALPAAPNVRYGMTLYRDRGDAYLTESVDFIPDVTAFVAELNRVEADGGGDYPEDLTEGLFRAIEDSEWRVENTVSLIFLIADAPPHLDYGDEEFNYAVHTGQAAELGIKVFAIASSGLDQQGEYIFRQMAQTTGGRFIFLTYGAEGAGSTGDQTEMTVDPDDFTVEALDDLIVKIVEDELAHQSKR